MELDFTKLNKSKLYIFPIYNTEARKKFHQYLETNYPLLVKHVSLNCFLFDSESSPRKPCCECNHGVILKEYKSTFGRYDDYDYGLDYGGYCSLCETLNNWEPRYECPKEEGIKFLNHHNIIVVGDYMKHYNFPNHAVKKKVDQIKFGRYYIINVPTIRLLNKRKLKSYIEDELFIQNLFNNQLFCSSSSSSSSSSSEE